jgi:PAS domain S-box-containing protein
MTVGTPPGEARKASDDGWQPLFWEAFRRSTNPMALFDEQRRHVEVNGAYLRLLGFSRGALIGRPIYDFVLGGPVMSAERWKAALGETQFTGIADLRRQDGGPVTVEFAGHPAVVNGKQVVLGVIMRVDRRGKHVARRPPHGSATEKLTKRELDVVRMIALGGTGPEIADELHVTHNTVRTHARNAMTKVGARSRAHLVAKALAEILYRQESQG